MRMTIILASICSLLISCATLTGGGEQAPAEQASLDSAAAPSMQSSLPELHDMGDGSQATQEVQVAEQQTAQVDTMNEQRSSSELDAAAPETASAGTDSFYASSQPAVAPEVEQVTESSLPTELPQKQVASWDQHTEAASSYQEETPAPVKKSKKVVKHKKESKKQIAKHSKKSKKVIAKASKKSKKVIAKKSPKADCKKIAKNIKKSSKREVAMCKAESKKKVASKSKSQKSRRVAQSGSSAIK